MLRDILIQAAKSHNFKLVISIEDIYFFQRKEGNAERYLIIKTLNNLRSIDDVHKQILDLSPKELLAEPSFSKNCDLILIHKLKNLSDFKDIEDIALSYEENPYYFKKYFLYFSDAEEAVINGKSFKDFASVILKMDEFEAYKKNPLNPSLYSVVARTFIKLPFLEVPKLQRTLLPLTDIIIEHIEEENLQKIFKTLSNYTQNNDIESLVQELLNEEMENLKAKDSSI